MTTPRKKSTATQKCPNAPRKPRGAPRRSLVNENILPRATQECPGAPKKGPLWHSPEGLFKTYKSRGMTMELATHIANREYTKIEWYNILSSVTPGMQVN